MRARQYCQKRTVIDSDFYIDFPVTGHGEMRVKGVVFEIGLFPLKLSVNFCLIRGRSPTQTVSEQMFFPHSAHTLSQLPAATRMQSFISQRNCLKIVFKGIFFPKHIIFAKVI